MNDIESFASVFDPITPYAGTPPKGFTVDFLGTLTDSQFRLEFGGDPEVDGGAFVKTDAPTIRDGEPWFEAVNWVEAAKNARSSYAMITLGACYGAQAVGAQRALAALNPMPYRLVSVEPDPENNTWIARHYRDNGIDPDDQWLINLAISDSNAPVFFPIGGAGTGAQNAISTNHISVRQWYFDEFLKHNAVEDALRSLLLYNSTGLTKELIPGRNFDAEVKLVSAVTLADVLSPFDRVDFLEADMQQSEAVVFPPYMDLLKRKVRRVHIGTHGRDIHSDLVELFRQQGWTIVFDYRPNDVFQTSLGQFETNDGVLTATNPALA
jgi:hypothetical protein